MSGCGPGTLTRLSASAALEEDVVRPVVAGGGGKRLLKTLLADGCERDCLYCPCRVGRDGRRASSTPDRMAAHFDRMHAAGEVDGLFLSSALVGGGVRTQQRLNDTVELVRSRYGFRGYVHLKIMPGARDEQIDRAVSLADRVSVNLEAPTESALARLAPHKRLFDELVRPLRRVHRLRGERGGPPGAWSDPSRGGPSQTTQFVVGPGGESDRDLLLTTERLRREAGLARTYFKAFTPVRDTPLARHPAESPVREHRLYQSDFLLRDYGFTAEELPYDAVGRLPLDADPKLAWARSVLAEEPAELNTAERSLLLRVPGIGPTGARRLEAARRGCTLRGTDQLRALGILADRAAPFVLLDGKRPAHQLDLFGVV